MPVKRILIAMGRRSTKARSPLTVLREPPIPAFHQERARKSYEALLDAAASLFAAHGYDGVGTPEIAAQAGVSVGTFYRYFDDKHEVYLEIMRRRMVTAYEQTIDRLRPEHFVDRARHETIRAAVDLLFQQVMTSPTLTRSFIEMSLRDREVAELRRAFEQLSVQRLGALIAAITPLADPEGIAYVLYGAALQCAYGLVVELVPTAIDRDRARAALTTFIERALFGDAVQMSR